MTETTTLAEAAEAVESAEAAAPVEQPPLQPPPRTAEALQLLMERESKIRQTEASVKEQQAQIDHAKKLVDLAKSNPLQFLDNVGTSYDALTEQVLQGQNPDPTVGLRKEIAELRKEFGVRQQREEATSRQAALDEVRSLVTSYVDNSPDYPLTKQAGMQNLVFERIQDHYNKTGQALSESSAAKEVEDYLLGVVDKLAQVESVRNRFTTQEQATEQPDVTQLANTLTNRQASTVPTRTDGQKPMTHSESIRQAAALLQFVDNT